MNGCLRSPDTDFAPFFASAYEFTLTIDILRVAMTISAKLAEKVEIAISEKKIIATSSAAPLGEKNRYAKITTTM
jgi:hypothetical protein